MTKYKLVTFTSRINIRLQMPNSNETVVRGQTCKYHTKM